MPAAPPIRPVAPEVVLDWIARVIDQRSDEDLARAAVAILMEMGGFAAVRVHRAVESGSHRFLRLLAASDGEPGALRAAAEDPLIAACWSDGAEAEAVMPESGRHRRVIPMLAAAGGVLGFLEAEADGSLAPRARLLAGLAAIVRGQLALLDDVERDTLTKLKNRKTFDENINRVIVHSATLASGHDADDRRRFPGPLDYHWLGMVDIDHFKRVNDEYGHVFGDEVLLLFAGLMRRTFRAGDLLFRYGGEEFVVVLEPTSFQEALAVFERFRHAVEVHDFPQVGRVTCSVGFIRILPGDIAAAVIGHADQALYHAKRNGRNRVCSYEMLVGQGLVVPEAFEGESELFA